MDESLDDIIKKVERNKRRFEKAQPTLLKVIKGASGFKNYNKIRY